MIKFIIGLLCGMALACLAAYLFITQGGLYMAVKGGPLPFERVLANGAIKASVGKHADDPSPVPIDEATLLAGAQLYRHNGCAGCHGLMSADVNTGRRFYPHAPKLLPPSQGVTDDPVGMTHWVVQSGIRFSAMPSFEGRLTETEIWQVSQFLQQADKLPASVQAALQPEPKTN